MTTVSNLNLSCIELDLGLGFDNIDDIEFVLVGGWVGGGGSGGGCIKSLSCQTQLLI